VWPYPGGQRIIISKANDTNRDSGSGGLCAPILRVLVFIAQLKIKTHLSSTHSTAFDVDLVFFSFEFDPTDYFHQPFGVLAGVWC